MTIQIDDAGWGSLVGGVLIGACRKESPQTQHAFQELDVSLFQAGVFSHKLYLEKAGDAAVALMVLLNASLDEPVEICTGYVLQAAKQRLAFEGYQVTSAKVGDPLQSLIERELLNRIRALGVETDYETLTEKQGLYFWQCVHWLKGGDVEAAAAVPEREKQCKTGWGTYPIWAGNPYSKAKVLAKRHKRQRRLNRFR